jgi:V/A-type H+-transporting ATPase subunit I
MAVAVGAEIPGMKPFVLPDHSLSAIDDLVEATSNRVGEIDAIFVNLAQHKAIIEAQNNDLLEKIEYETAKAGMETLDPASVESSIAWLGGYVPSEKIDALKKVAEENVWTLVWDDPAPTDQPPTLLKNNAVVRIIQPLFSVLGTVPGYREYDISLSYMFFMCFFFAMIFGDAGYGAFLFVVGLVIGLLMKKKNGTFPDATKLVMLFSVFAIIWGSMIGSWFGIPVQSLPLALQALILPPFNNTGVPAGFPPVLRGIFKLPETVPVNELKTQWSIQFLCFTIGMFQLVWGRLKNTFNRLPHLAAVAELGWLVVVIGMYFLVLSILLKIPLPTFPVYFIVAGLAANLIFAEQKGGNFFKNIGKSLGNFFQIFLKVVGCFADIISYIRLFAVGMAGAMIAQTFNGMAIPADGLGDFGLGFVLRLIPAVLILAVGHALNLLMNTLSLIIHGVRLNLLEYAGNHLGMDWSGYAYKPFASRQKNTMNE